LKPDINPLLTDLPAEKVSFRVNCKVWYKKA